MMSDMSRSPSTGKTVMRIFSFTTSSLKILNCHANQENGFSLRKKLTVSRLKNVHVIVVVVIGHLLHLPVAEDGEKAHGRCKHGEQGDDSRPMGRQGADNDHDLSDDWHRATRPEDGDLPAGGYDRDDAEDDGDDEQHRGRDRLVEEGDGVEGVFLIFLEEAAEAGLHRGVGLVQQNHDDFSNLSDYRKCILLHSNYYIV